MNKILKICHRGFANEAIYISVQDHEIIEADQYLDTLVDNTSDTSKWLSKGWVPNRNGGKCDYTWRRYKAEVLI